MRFRDRWDGVIPRGPWTPVLGCILSSVCSQGCDSAARPGRGDQVQNPPSETSEAFDDRLAFSTAGAAAEVVFDDRLRPVQVLAAGLKAWFSWAESAGSVSLTVERPDGAVEVVLETAFDDSALLEALDRAEFANGPEAESLRQWVADNPGRVERVTSGEAEPPMPAQKRAVLQQYIPNPEVDRYISRLGQAVLVLTATAERLMGLILTTESPAEDHLLDLYEIMRAAEAALARVYRDHAAVCIPNCTLACPVTCAQEGSGACCGRTDEARNCDYTTREHCDGVFWEGFTCEEVVCDLSACCLDNGECHNVPDEASCNQLMLDQGAPGYSFSPNTTCSAGGCGPRGACCVVNCPAHECYDDVTEEHCRGELGGEFRPGESCDAGDTCRMSSTCPGCCVRTFPGGVECSESTLDECSGPDSAWLLPDACQRAPCVEN